MLFFPHNILTVGGKTVDAEQWDPPVGFSYLSLAPVAYDPPPSAEGQYALVAGLVGHILKERKKIQKNEDGFPDVMIADRARIFSKTIKENLPEDLCTLLNDPNTDEGSLRKALEDHFLAKNNAWPRPSQAGLSTEQRALEDMFGAKTKGSVAITGLWEKTLPPWLTQFLSNDLITIIPVRSDLGGEHIPTYDYLKVMRYDKSAPTADVTKALLEETLHMAQRKSSYWQKHQIAIDDATKAFEARVYARGTNAWQDQSPEAKGPRKLLRRNTEIDNNRHFRKYDAYAHHKELIVDMAFIEAQLLGGATSGKRISQKKVDEVMQSRFPEMYPHYKAFINDCIDGAVKNLPAEEKKRLEEQWKASPFGEFAKQVYKPSDRKTR